MKKIILKISGDCEVTQKINELDKLLPNKVKSFPEFQIIYPEITSCIDNFCQLSKKLSSSGTSMNVEKDFLLNDTKIVINLEYPQKKSFLNKLKNFF